MDPVNWVDPEGEIAIVPIAAVIVVGVAGAMIGGEIYDYCTASEIERLKKEMKIKDFFYKINPFSKPLPPSNNKPRKYMYASIQ